MLLELKKTYAFPEAIMMFPAFIQPYQFDETAPITTAKWGGQFAVPKSSPVYEAIGQQWHPVQGNPLQESFNTYHKKISITDGDASEYEDSHGKWLISAKKSAYDKYGQPRATTVPITLADGQRVFAGDPENLNAISENCFSGQICTFVVTMLLDTKYGKHYFTLNAVSIKGGGTPIQAQPISADMLNAIPQSNMLTGGTPQAAIAAPAPTVRPEQPSRQAPPLPNSPAQPQQSTARTTSPTPDSGNPW